MARCRQIDANIDPDLSRHMASLNHDECDDTLQWRLGSVMVSQITGR